MFGRLLLPVCVVCSGLLVGCFFRGWCDLESGFEFVVGPGVCVFWGRSRGLIVRGLLLDTFCCELFWGLGCVMFRWLVGLACWCLC